MTRRAFRLSVLIALWALTLSGLTPAHAQQGFVPPGFERAAAAQGAHGRDLANIDGVVGVGLGLSPGGEPALLVLTEDLGVGGIPRRLDGVPVIVKVSGKVYARPKPNCDVDPTHPSCGGDSGSGDTTGAFDRTARQDVPVPIGVSTGNGTSCSAGTIGALLVAGNAHYAMSNNHVYVPSNNPNSIGQSIRQQGVYDTSNCVLSETQAIGTLHAFVRLDFTGGINTVDVAIAAVDQCNGGPCVGSATPAEEGYGQPAGGTGVDVSVGDSVMKYGRTTGETVGTVIGVNFGTVNVSYPNGTAKFDDQIVVEGDKGGFLKAGDSGSLLVLSNGSNDVVGLCFASGRGGKIAFCNPIGLVLDALADSTVVEGGALIDPQIDGGP